MRLSEENPFGTCANPQAHNQKLNRANRYENEIIILRKWFKHIAIQTVQVHLMTLRHQKLILPEAQVAKHYGMEISQIPCKNYSTQK